VSEGRWDGIGCIKKLIEDRYRLHNAYSQREGKNPHVVPPFVFSFRDNHYRDEMCIAHYEFQVCYPIIGSMVSDEFDWSSANSFGRYSLNLWGLSRHRDKEVIVRILVPLS
jgi:hypothetical protein